MAVQLTLNEMYRHFGPVIEKYFEEKKMGAVMLRVTGSTTDETLKKAYGRDAVIEFIEEILSDFKRD